MCQYRVKDLGDHDTLEVYVLKNKDEISVELESDQLTWLDQVVSDYDFPDESKALRVLIDYAIQDGDADLIFSPENMRCQHC